LEDTRSSRHFRGASGRWQTHAAACGLTRGVTKPGQSGTITLPTHPPTSDCPVIAITVNGESRHFEPPINCAELLARFELAGKRVALERNGEIVPRSRFAQQMLADGDRLEIVVAVGGG